MKQRMSTEKKVSQMILGVAAQFIELGKTEEERQTNLDIACKAWNLSILPKSKRNKEYNNYLNEMKPIVSAKLRNIETDTYELNLRHKITKK